MRTTLTLDDDLLERATSAMGDADRSAVIHEGLRLVIQRDAARRLTALGGSAPGLTLAPRRRPAVADAAPARRRA